MVTYTLLNVESWYFQHSFIIRLYIYLYLWQRANGEQIADAAHKLFSNYLYIDYNQLEIGLFPRSKGSLEIHGTYVIYFKYVILIMVS